ncbi:TetR/AcrR family transcriptional regulator [Streptomyces sp. NBC_01190]|uniref:TetR/AcrR family transcriptional regulator n=1 Tax=Streptomyces sp. NBC_01190 TaxID=2903767 RepID=UPI00386983B9|nr:TetR/AcrR family transcriptional regulator [Streptomyces sp. NBC_01190]
MDAKRAGSRRDAVANRTALLDAAAVVLLREGPRVSLDVVAREARVGIATLYRNFANRDELFGAVARRAYETVAALADEAASSERAPLEAVATFFSRVVEAEPFSALPLIGASAEGEYEPIGERISDALDAVLRRGMEDGSIRADASSDDLVVAGAMLARAQLPAADWGPAAGRLIGIIVDGLRERPDVRPLPPPPGDTYTDPDGP